jgi:hypothetical protein
MCQCNDVVTVDIVLGKNILHKIHLKILPQTFLFVSSERR